MTSSPRIRGGQYRTGTFPAIAWVPVVVLVVLMIVTQFLPETDFFDFVRGMFSGMFAVALVATIVGVFSARRRARLRAENAALDALEPLGSPPVNRDAREQDPR